VQPCGNEDCDICVPLPRWRVGTETVERRVHTREIKAATAEEALRIYAEGTAWPSDYDTRTTEVLEESTVRVESAPPKRANRAKWNCFHNLDRMKDPDDPVWSEDDD
jgi:hypothetical protein